MSFLTTLLALAPLLQSTTAYGLKYQYDSTNFFDSNSFNFYSGWDDFTQGYALYNSKAIATAGGYAKVTNNKVFIGVDNTTTLTNTTPGPGNGRGSIRLEGTQTFDNGLVIGDFDHMPAGACGLWPSFWLLHDDGDGYSEIDIVENISLQQDNEVSLYSDVSTCNMKDNGGTGTTRGTDCRLSTGGCGVNGADGTFGSSFNSGGGGYWAAQIESTGIKVWFFPRGSAPADISGSSPDPSKWAKPMLNFGAGTCNITNGFRKMKIIFNITFCGAYAGSNTWGTYTGCQASTKTSTCEAYVAANPSAMKDVYFLVNSVKLFQQSVTPSSTSSKSTGKPTSTIANKAAAGTPTSSMTTKVASTTKKATSTPSPAKVKAAAVTPTSTKKRNRRCPTAIPDDSSDDGSDDADSDN